MKLQLKFRAGTSSAHREGVIAKATRAGAAQVRPLFPGEKDAELASLYVVDVEDPKHQGVVRSMLSAERHVEFVEDEIQRKLRSGA